MISCPTKLISVQICTGKKRATHVKVRPLFSPSTENKKNQAILFVDRVPILVNALTAGTTPCMRVYTPISSTMFRNPAPTKSLSLITTTDGVETSVEDYTALVK
jgi:hypothetical protein